MSCLVYIFYCKNSPNILNVTLYCCRLEKGISESKGNENCTYFNLWFSLSGDAFKTLYHWEYNVRVNILSEILIKFKDMIVKEQVHYYCSKRVCWDILGNGDSNKE